MGCGMNPLARLRCRKPPKTTAMASVQLSFTTTLPWLRARLRVVVSLIAFGFASLAAAQQQPLMLTDSTPSIEVWPAVSILTDPGKGLRIERILEEQPEFKRPDTAYATLGLRKEAVWVRFPVTVAPQSNGQWVLDIDYAVINHINLYVLNGKKIAYEATLGNLQPVAERPIRSRAHTVAIILQPGQSYDFYLRVENNGSMILPITLSKPSSFLARTLQEQMIQGLLTGLALCLLVYSLANWLTLREHLFAKYALLVTGSLLFSLLQFGIGAQYVWPGSAWMELHMGGLSALTASTGSFLFIEQALAGPDTKPWFSRVMKIGAGLLVVCGFAYALDLIDVQQITAIVSTLGMAPALLGMPGAIKKARRGDSVGTYFLVAWAVYLISAVVLIEVIKGRIGVNFWTLHSFQIGATLDMLLFMRVLGLRTKALQSEIKAAHRERDSFHSLAYSDPLTGLANRRSLNASISKAIERASASHMLAVYMLDLDGFKQVNDQFGHDVGDELLIAVAARLKSSLRTSDVVARLGGDEFLVLSTDLKHEQQARDLGEKLLAAFTQPFTLSMQTCQIGITIGYALAPQDGQDTAKLLKRADAAMYAGKNSGKNCVRRDGV